MSTEMNNTPTFTRHAVIYFDQALHDADGSGWVLQCSTWNLLSCRFGSLSELLKDMDSDPYWRMALTGTDRPCKKADLVRGRGDDRAIDYFVTCTECHEDIFCVAESRSEAITNAEFFGWTLDVVAHKVICPDCSEAEVPA